MQLKNKNTKQKHEMCKTNVKTNIYYVINMNMKITWQGYGAKSCLRLMLNILKEMKGLISIYTPLET
jgi:hypothetical protein